MKIGLMKFLDRWIGIPLCLILSIGRIFDVFRETKRGEINKILVIRIWGRGDLVIALPILRALRKKFPEAHVTMLITNRIKDIVEGDPCIDELITLDTSKVSQIIKTFAGAIKKIRKGKFDLTVDLEQYLRTSALFAYLSRARIRVGFDTSNQWRGFLFTHKVPFNPDQHVLDCFSDLINAVGVSLPIKKLEKLWITAEDREFALKFLKASGISDDELKIGIHVGSSENTLSKRWPKERFAQLADKLMQEYRAKVIFVGGPNEMLDIEDVIKLMNAEPINAVRKMSLQQTAALLEKCNLFIGNDSALMHIAAAMGAPTIGLFGPSLPSWFGPYGEEHMAIYKSVGCNPCYIPHFGKIPKCAKGENICMKAITVDDVMEAAARMINSRGQ